MPRTRPYRFIALSTLALAAGALPAHAAGGSPIKPPSDLLFGVTRGPFLESYQPESLDSRASVERYSLDWRWRVDEENQVFLRLTRGSYQIADEDFPGTIHQRSETGVLVANLQRTSLFGLGLTYGLGYGIQALTVDSTAKAPGSDPAFLFVPWQAYHGFTLLGGCRQAIGGPFGLAFDAEVVPYAFTNFGDSRLSLTWLTTFRLAPRATFWNDRASIGYFYERALGSGFNREASGVLASVSMVGF